MLYSYQLDQGPREAAEWQTVSLQAKEHVRASFLNNSSKVCPIKKSMKGFEIANKKRKK